MTKHTLWLTCAAGALVFGASAAHAATATATATDTATDNAGSVAELVVVAEHRETALQKIPVAVSVFTGAQRDVLGINSVQDVTNFAPGFVYDTTTTHPYIRGVGRQSVNVTDDERVASYEDEFFVYTAYELKQSSLFLTQEQIERGPQNVGGRNAAAGSIDMISVRPTDHPYAELRATIGNFGTYNLEGAASGEIAPGLTARIAGSYLDQEDGYYKNLARNITQGGIIHEWYLQGQVDWKINDKADLWVKGFWSEWDGNEGGDAGGLSGFSSGHWDETNLSDSDDALSGSLFVNPNYGFAAIPGSPAALGHNPADPLPIAVTLMNSNVTDNPTQINPFDEVTTDPLDHQVNLKNYRGLSGIFTYDFGGVQMKYIGGIQGYDYDLHYQDGDSNVLNYTLPGNGSPCALLGSPFTCAQTLGGIGLGALAATLPAASNLVITPTTDLHYVEDDYWWSHELTFQSTNDNPLQWEAGAWFYHQHYTNPITFSAPGQANLTNPDTLTSFLGALANPLPGYAPFGPLAGLLTALTPGQLTAAAPNPGHILSFLDYTFDVQSVAGYGQVSYKFNDQLKISGNLRYTSDTKTGTEATRFVAFGSSTIDPLLPFLGGATPSFDATLAATCPTGNPASCNSGTVLGKGVASAGVIGADGVLRRRLAGSSSAVTGGAGIEFTPTNDIFMYARYGRGYEDISFNAGFSSANPEVSPEFLNSYEVGYKQSFGRSLRVDMALFYYDYEQIQLPISVSVGGLLQNEFINAPKAESAGFELEGYWSPVRNLSATVSYSYDYTAILTGCTGTVSGGVLTPATGALCLVDTQDPDAVAPGAHPVAGQTPTATRDQSVKGNPLPGAPLNKLGLNVAYTLNFDPGDLTISGSFEYRSSQNGTVFNVFYSKAPSWTGADLRLLWKGKEDRYEIIGYVKNVFNSLQYQTGSGGSGLLGDNTKTYSAATGLNWVNNYNLAPPRTYGVELRYKFF